MAMKIVATTLTPLQVQAPGVHALAAGSLQSKPLNVEVGNENFVATSLDLSGRQQTPVRLTVLGSYDQAAKFLDNLNRLLLLLGLTAVLVGSGLVFLISHTFTRPLGTLVEGVRALEHGDFYHPLDSRGSDEVAELTSAFDRMRASLLKTQQALLESEQLATIGRMASSISHDLRHALAAVVANSEFLCDGGLTSAQREELYQEVRTGVNQMTDLIDSLLEFARTRESLNPTYANILETVQRAMQAVRLHPRHQGTLIEVHSSGQNVAWFDPRKLERALYNLLLNACEAAPSSEGRVEVTIERALAHRLQSRSRTTDRASRRTDSGEAVSSLCKFRQRERYGTWTYSGAEDCAGSWWPGGDGTYPGSSNGFSHHDPRTRSARFPGRQRRRADGPSFPASRKPSSDGKLNSTFGYVVTVSIFLDFTTIRMSRRRMSVKKSGILALRTSAITATAFILLSAGSTAQEAVPDTTSRPTDASVRELCGGQVRELRAMIVELNASGECAIAGGDAGGTSPGIGANAEAADSTGSGGQRESVETGPRGTDDVRRFGDGFRKQGAKTGRFDSAAGLED